MPTLSQRVLEDYNQKAQQVYNNCGMIKCPNCSRTFNIDSVSSHMKACNNKYGTDADPFSSPGKKKQSRPQGIVCYICGREYFSKSINIHIEQCKVKFLNEQKKKPRHERKKLPNKPTNFDDMAIGGASQSQRDAYNDEAFKEYNENALEMCDGCGRTFNPESLPKHQKGCKGPGGFKKNKEESKGGFNSSSGGMGSSGKMGGSRSTKKFGSPSPKR